MFKFHLICQEILSDVSIRNSITNIWGSVCQLPSFRVPSRRLSLAWRRFTDHSIGIKNYLVKLDLFRQLIVSLKLVPHHFPNSQIFKRFLFKWKIKKKITKILILFYSQCWKNIFKSKNAFLELLNQKLINGFVKKIAQKIKKDFSNLNFFFHKIKFIRSYCLENCFSPDEKIKEL